MGAGLFGPGGYSVGSKLIIYDRDGEGGGHRQARLSWGGLM